MIMSRMTLAEEPDFTARYPGEYNCRITLTGSDGNTHIAHTAWPKGHRSNPMSDAEVETKFRNFAGAAALTSAQCDRALEAICGLWIKLPNLEPVFRQPEHQSLISSPVRRTLEPNSLHAPASRQMTDSESGFPRADRLPRGVRPHDDPSRRRPGPGPGGAAGSRRGIPGPGRCRAPAASGRVCCGLRSDSAPRTGLQPEELAALLGRYLFQEQGFQGNSADYYNPDNSYFNRVLDTHTGIPITLSLLFLEVARRVGLRCRGVGMPGTLPGWIWKARRSISTPSTAAQSLTADDCRQLAEGLFGPRMAWRDDYLTPCTKYEFLFRLSEQPQGGL